ncbi:hypothetical protein GV819_23585 [Pseudomonas sp. Fl5BN2]|uniref:hypothetical protein n=1 Tax=unclassified Pseudomonas TaxID=196821 RepID=UPI001377574B|nr:hypothetical protein [Pseudomonas sp. Fl5BN2]NBF05275.1 hypothetical protein [Pseudomonas sp. Fl5BN2]
MQAQHPSSSDSKAITSPAEGMQKARHLMAIRIVGTALFDYQVQKTAAARIRLESLATMAQAQGDLTDIEALVVAQVLATSNNPIQQMQERNHV